MQPTTSREWFTSGVTLALSFGLNLGTANNGNVISITNNRNTARAPAGLADKEWD